MNGSGSYRPPSFEELYFEQGNVRGNPNLSAEKAWSTDIQVRVGAPKAWVQVGPFIQRIENLIVFQPTSVFRVEATNSQAAISRGVEAEAQAHLSNVLVIRAGGTALETRVDTTGLPLPGRSPWTL